VGEIKWIQAKMDALVILHLDTSKDIQNLAVDIKERLK
jgi:hypothetical protein